MLRDRIETGVHGHFYFKETFNLSSGIPNIQAKKSLGQHFLVDRALLNHIVAAAALEPDDVVVEVGPGKGIVTERLASAVSKVVAVELDQGMVRYLNQTLGEYSNVSVLCADAREIAPRDLVGDASYKVVANLPYYAASPIIRHFLEAEHKPVLMVVMVQKEVAQNMAAAPGRMGLLSVAIQLYGEPKIVADVPPRAFRPVPKVSSAIVKIDVYQRPRLLLDSVDDFFRLVKAGFSARRKQLKNAISNDLKVSSQDAEDLLALAAIDPMRRAQTLSLEEWGGLYQAWRLNYGYADSKSPRKD